MLIAVHFFCFIISLYREIYDNAQGVTPDFMRLFEVIMAMVYCGVVLVCLNYYTTIRLLDKGLIIIAQEMISHPTAQHCLKD